MQQIQCSNKLIDEIYETFDEMEYRADDYVPTEDDMTIIASNLSKYIAFLMWIDDTGYETEENSSMRKVISSIIKSSLVMEE